MGANGSGWVSRGSHGHNGAHFHGGTEKQGETRQKPAIRACFAGVITVNKTSLSWQGWSRGQRGCRGGNNNRPTGARCDVDGHK